MLSSIYKFVIKPLDIIVLPFSFFVGMYFFFRFFMGHEQIYLLIGSLLYVFGYLIRRYLTKVCRGINQGEILMFYLGFALLGYFLYFTKINTDLGSSLKELIIYNTMLLFLLILTYIFSLLKTSKRSLIEIIIVFLIIAVFDIAFKSPILLLRDFFTLHSEVTDWIFFLSIPYLVLFLTGYLSLSIAELKKNLFS